MPKLTHSEIEFEFDGIQYHFDILSNLPKKRGLSIGDALENWIARAKRGNITERAFCNYITGKDPVNFIAIPKSEFDKQQAK